LNHVFHGGPSVNDLQRSSPAAVGALRGIGAWLCVASGQKERNRRDLYGGAAGLRIVTFHETPPDKLDELKRVVDWALDHFDLATPSDVDDLVAGRFHAYRDRVLFTCDDGIATNYVAAAWLARLGVKATFFIVPSLIGRTVAEFVDWHARLGVAAMPPITDLDARGLAKTEVLEMLAMGHRIAAHNFAHRDLGLIHDAPSLHYEIDQALDAVSELTGSPCMDFAIGFGQPENVSKEAVTHLMSRCPNVYSCYRGLNVPGRSPRFLLRHGISSDHPFVFTRVAIDGGADHLILDKVREMLLRVGTVPPRRGEKAEGSEHTARSEYAA